MRQVRRGWAPALLACFFAFARADMLPFAARDNILPPYTRCTFEDDLAVVSVERAPHLPMARPVETDSGTKRVSVADGYRIMLAYPDTDYFVNLKVELSVAGSYAADKQTILEQMQRLSARSPGSVTFERSTRQGIDIAAVNSTKLVGGTLDFYSFFDDDKGLVASAYILNQRPERSVFKTLDAFRNLRDKFVNSYVACMAKNH